MPGQSCLFTILYPSPWEPFSPSWIPTHIFYFFLLLQFLRKLKNRQTSSCFFLCGKSNNASWFLPLHSSPGIHNARQGCCPVIFQHLFWWTTRCKKGAEVLSRESKSIWLLTTWWKRIVDLSRWRSFLPVISLPILTWHPSPKHRLKPHRNKTDRRSRGTHKSLLRWV